LGSGGFDVNRSPSFSYRFNSGFGDDWRVNYGFDCRFNFNGGFGFEWRSRFFDGGGLWGLMAWLGRKFIDVFVGDNAGGDLA